MSAIEEIQEFAKTVTEGVNNALGEVEPGSDPMPILIVENDEEVAFVGLPLNLDDGSLKDVLFGQLFPAVIEKHEAKKVAFASFAWLTLLSKDEQAAIKAELDERGASPSDTAAVREVAESLGIVISGADRRQEVCNVTAASLEAECMILGYVERDEGVPTIEWVMEPPDLDRPEGPGAVFIETGDPDKNQVGLGGRVIEGMREGLRLAARERGDWRTDD